MNSRPRVLHVAPTALRADRASELERIFGCRFETVEAPLGDLSAIVEMCAQTRCDVVVLDVAPTELIAEMLSSSISTPVLRPVREKVRTPRGDVLERFASYERLLTDGTTEPLAKGSFAH